MMEAPRVDSSCEDQAGPAHPGTFLASQYGKSDHAQARVGVDFPVFVVLPAGGSGERTGLQTPKQFCLLLGRPLISYTIEAFERVSWIRSIVVVVAKENTDLMAAIVGRFRHAKVRVVAGGSTRHRSIWNGVMALSEVGEEEAEGGEDNKVVIIHDAVRPFVDEDLLYRVTVAAREHGASGAIRPLVSTVIATTSEGFLDHSLERAKYRASEMPQAFMYNVIQRAYKKCTEADFDFGTECLHLVLRYCGTNAKLIEGPPTLWKITYKRDLAAAESVIKDTVSRRACMITGRCSHARMLADSLHKAFCKRETELDMIPDVKGDNVKYLLKAWTFIQLSMNDSDLDEEVETTFAALEATNQTLLHPVVVVVVHLSTMDRWAAEPTAFAKLASGAKLRNILLYGVNLQQSKIPFSRPTGECLVATAQTTT
ncbi:D-ribitol-5-phosphate cytidylyltransferase isoform X2 [Syngnathoides biaculeatus]|uniref:D-ribitol-5-phosphate cytidylyltransferase isoform X2 n=1 Tax=Syngnathoides biaculeatus TaxID=300417 RepID=UPI002ADE700D|nr:D-ribitol-5-phosphate cytidylyltransferase isoform X2 [Syngnathoides biaculeatus]